MNKILNQNLYKLKNLVLFLLINKNLSIKTIMLTDQNRFKFTKDNFYFLRQFTTDTKENFTFGTRELSESAKAESEKKKSDANYTLPKNLNETDTTDINTQCALNKIYLSKISETDKNDYHENLRKLWELVITKKIPEDIMLILILTDASSITNNIFLPFKLHKTGNLLKITINPPVENINKLDILDNTLTLSKPSLLFDIATNIIKIGLTQQQIVTQYNKDNLKDPYFRTEWASQNSDFKNEWIQLKAIFKNEWIQLKAMKMKNVIRAVAMLCALASAILSLIYDFTEKKELQIAINCIAIVAVLTVIILSR